LTDLDGPRRGPTSGETRSLVVLLHGYGADGNDLIGLADAIGGHLPGTAFAAPNAPERCAASPMGFQWFPIPWMDGSPEAEMARGFAAAREALHAFLAAEMDRRGVGPERTALLGFSQGTMMSLAVGPGIAPALAGIVGFSGRVADEAALSAAPSRPPVLLAHGDMDELIPVAEMERAERALTAAGYEVATHVSRGMGHGIAPDALGLALRFLVDRLGTTGGEAVDGRAT